MTDVVAAARWAPEWRIEHFETIGSTNSALLEVGRQGAAPGLVYVSDQQTAGRGRLDRRWWSEPGQALMLSILLPPVPETAIVATRVVALALADLCDELGVEASLKWPNDVMVGEAKLAGILGESTSVGDRLEAAVVGCGLNVVSAPDPGQGRRATALNSHLNHPATPRALLPSLLDHLSIRFASGTVADDFARSCSTVGTRVVLETPSGLVEGVATAVGPTGELILDTPKGEVAVAIGEALRTVSSQRT